VRQHVASLVAVFLALAVGIVLGGGLLAGGDDDDGGSDEQPSASSTERPAPPSDGQAGFADAFAGAGAARLYAAGLTGHAAAILTMPGADTAHVKLLQAQIVAAGARSPAPSRPATSCSTRPRRRSSTPPAAS
jgi:hypothetical protein